MSKNIQRQTARLRELLARPGCIVAPGVADAFGARLVKMEGFDADRKSTRLNSSH